MDAPMALVLLIIGVAILIFVVIMLSKLSDIRDELNRHDRVIQGNAKTTFSAIASVAPIYKIVITYQFGDQTLFEESVIPHNYTWHKLSRDEAVDIIKERRFKLDSGLHINPDFILSYSMVEVSK
jgi:hypothetical protein